MDSKKEHKDEGDAAYLASFESSDKRRKKVLISFAVIFAIIVVAGFFITLGSLGRLGKNVNAAFNEAGSESSGAPPADEQAPAQ